MKRIVALSLILISGCFLGIADFAQAEDEKITITTYYPAPYGVYKNLKIQDGKLIVDSDDKPQIEINSDTDDAGIHIKASVGQDPYIEFEDSGDIVRVEGDNTWLKVSGPLRSEGVATPKYLRIYKND